MPLEVLPAGEADAARSVAIEDVAYGPNPIGSCCFPGPFPSPGPGVKTRADTLVDGLRADPACRWYKVVDTDLEGEDQQQQMIAFAQWYMWDDPGHPDPPLQFGPGTNPEACEAFFGGMREKRMARFENKPYVYLKLLHTHPDHKRRGAGTMLLKRGLEEAERLGLPCYLEASPQGKPLYEKVGFKEVDTFYVDLSKWGGPPDFATALMLHPAQAKK